MHYKNYKEILNDKFVKDELLFSLVWFGTLCLHETCPNKQNAVDILGHSRV